MNCYEDRGRWFFAIALVMSVMLLITVVAGRADAHSASTQSADWIVQDISVDGSRIAMMSANDGWILETGPTAKLYRWNGSAWRFFTDLPHTEYVVRGDIAMVSATDGWVVLGGPLSGSSDLADSTFYRWNGSSWNKFETVTAANAVSLESLDMLSPTDGWATGSFNFGTIYYRWNGGSWQLVSEKFNSFVGASIDMLSPIDGWNVGFSGIARWNGSDWVDESSPVPQELNDVAMVSPSDGWIVGGGLDYDPDTGELIPEPGVILRWNGTSWGQVPSPVDDRLLAVDIISANDAWIAGDNGTILHWNGVSWIEVPVPTTQSGSELVGIDMLSSTSGWAVGSGGVLAYLLQPELSVNYESGAPGSYFSVSGIDFPEGEMATVTANGQELGTAPVGSDGTLSFILSTLEADEGYYVLTASVNPSATIQFILDVAEPVRPQEGVGSVISVPAGIAHNELLFLPTVSR